jgi:hypothetical protein
MGKKYESFATQRESCRLNKYAYTEKIDLAGGAKLPVLFCNYPFGDPHHKKGVCKASTCTDMRAVPQEVVIADLEGKDEAITPPLTDDGQTNRDTEETVGKMACPDNG